jgi:hypothetical protein
MAIVRTRNLDLVQKKITKLFIDDCMKKFMPRIHDKITIKVKGLSNLLQDEGIHADVIYEESWSPREFVLRIDTTQSYELFLKSLAHECVHVKQWAKGEMKQYERDYKMTRWHKQKINSVSTFYGDLPWEIEAHGREYGLYWEFLSKYDDLAGIIDGTHTDYKLLGPKQMVFKFGR